MKTLNLILFHQKEFVYSLQICHYLAFLSTMLILSPSFDTTSISINTTLLPFSRFLCVSLTISHFALNHSAASMTLYKLRHFILAFFILATIFEKC